MVQWPVGTRDFQADQGWHHFDCAYCSYATVSVTVCRLVVWWQPANQGMFKPETETLTHETVALQTSSSSSDNGANSILRVYGHIRPKTVWTRDTSAPVPKCLRTVRYKDILALRHFGLRAETVRTIGPDTTVLGPGHFSTTSNTYAGKSALLLPIGVIHRPNVFCNLVTHFISL